MTFVGKVSYRHRENFMGFHCGNTCPRLLRNSRMGCQLIIKRDLGVTDLLLFLPFLNAGMPPARR